MPGVTLAVVPSATPGDSRAALAELCRALEALLGIEVTALHPESYGALTDLFEKGRVTGTVIGARPKQYFEKEWSEVLSK